MDAHRAREHLPLHPLAFRILLGLRGGPRHGYAIVKEIEARERGVGGKIFPANLYRRIRDLVDGGLVEHAEAPPDADGGRPRRYFRLTPIGLRVAHAEAERLEDLVTEAKHILTAAERTTP